MILYIILLSCRKYVGNQQANSGLLKRSLPLAYSRNFIEYESLMSVRFSQVLLPSDQYTSRLQPLVVFLFSGAQFGIWMNPSYFWMAFSAYQLSKTSLNIINSLPPISHEVKIYSATQFSDTSTPSTPYNTALYNLVYKIGLAV